jgi:hypothetical protein
MSRVFARRVSSRFLNRLSVSAGSHTRDELVVIPGVSHAYLNVFRLLPEGVRAMRLSAQWVKEALHTEINTRDNGYANVNARL